MAMRNLSFEELQAMAALPKGVDLSDATKQGIAGATLNDVILAKQLENQAKQHELKKSVDEILAKKRQAKLVETFAKKPADEALRAQAFPEEEAKYQYDLSLLNAKQKAEQNKAAKATGSVVQSRILQQAGVEGVIDELTRGVKILPEGTGAAALAKVQSLAGGRLGGNPKVTTYDKLRDSVAVAIYKFISGDVGNIAASESKMARDLVPAIMDSAGVREEKLATLKRAAARAKTALNDLVQSGRASQMTPEELRKAQLGIADNAIAEAVAEGPGIQAPEATPENPGKSGLTPEQRRARIAELKARQGRP